MRIALIVAAVALATGATADPQPTASEIFALRTECGKLGEECAKKHPLASYPAVDLEFADTFYSAKTNRCFVVVTTDTRESEIKIERRQILKDAQTGAQIALCHLTNIQPEKNYRVDKGDEEPCAYIEKVKREDLAEDASPSKYLSKAEK